MKIYGHFQQTNKHLSCYCAHSTNVHCTTPVQQTSSDISVGAVSFKAWTFAQVQCLLTLPPRGSDFPGSYVGGGKTLDGHRTWEKNHFCMPIGCNTGRPKKYAIRTERTYVMLTPRGTRFLLFFIYQTFWVLIQWLKRCSMWGHRAKKVLL